MAFDAQNTKQMIEDGKAVLGIEFGSTRIKAILINEKNEPGWHPEPRLGKPL